MHERVKEIGAFCCQRRPVNIVNEAIENGVCERRSADDLVPFLDRNPIGDNRRGALVTIFEVFAVSADRPQLSKIRTCARERFSRDGISVIAASESQCVQEARHAMIENVFPITTALWPSA